MTKKAITAICIGLLISSCGNDELHDRASITGDTSHDEHTESRQITFSPDLRIGAPTAGTGSNVGALRYSFEDGDKIGLFGVPYTEGVSEATGMSDITDIPGFHFFNQPLTYNQTDGTLTPDDGPLFMPNDDNLRIYAYYPYNADGITYNEEYGWVLPWSINEDDLGATPDYMCPAGPAYISNANTPIQFGQFNHLFGAIAFKIYTNDPDVAASARATSLILRCTTYDRGFISLADGEVITPNLATIDNKEFTLDTAIQQGTSSAEVKPTLAYILPPGSILFNRTRVIVNYDGRNYNLLIKKEDQIEVEAGTIINYNFYLRKADTRSTDTTQLIIESNTTTQDWNESNQ